jgi:hypothetical protein
MDERGNAPAWLGLAVADCPVCHDAVAFNDGSYPTVIHEASRSNQSSWSIGIQCPACHSRIVTRVTMTQGMTAPHVDVVGYFEPHGSRR